MPFIHFMRETPVLFISLNLLCCLIKKDTLSNNDRWNGLTRAEGNCFSIIPFKFHFPSIL